MATPKTFRTHQKSMFFRRIQVILIGVIAVSVLEQSSKRHERMQVDRANQRIAKTSQRKTAVKSVTPHLKPIATQASQPQASDPLPKLPSDHHRN